MASKKAAKIREGPQRCWSLKDIQDLVDVLNKREIDEFELEETGFKIRIRRGKVVDESSEEARTFPTRAIAPAPEARLVPLSVTPPAETTAVPAVLPKPPTPAESTEELHVVKTPIVGTFFAAPSPGAPAFVSVGDFVEVGQALCIVEAMKLMNEIESDVAGEIVKVFVENGQPVEYGQPLFGIRVSTPAES